MNALRTDAGMPGNTPTGIAHAASPGEPPRWKRALDVTCLGLAAPLMLPLLLAIAAWIKCVSRGTAIFRQPRVGWRGRKFVCLKFRTMKADADPGLHQQHIAALVRSGAPMMKLDADGDPRLIRGGRFLRATGLDELPQLLNVLRGEMSLVGPRPCLGYEFDLYHPRDRRRFDALPGLTGLWQVSGKNRTTFAEMIALDISYVEHQSFGLDIAILWRTLPVLISQAWQTLRPRLARFRGTDAEDSRALQPGPSSALAGGSPVHRHIRPGALPQATGSSPLPDAYRG